MTQSVTLELARRYMRASGDLGHVTRAWVEGDQLVFRWRQRNVLLFGRGPEPTTNRGTTRVKLDELTFRIDTPRKRYRRRRP